MKNTRRALRRYHRQRMIARTTSFTPIFLNEEERLQRALRRYKNRQKCSCYMCGHRRKWNGPTIQERRMNQRGAD